MKLGVLACVIGTLLVHQVAGGRLWKGGFSIATLGVSNEIPGFSLEGIIPTMSGYLPISFPSGPEVVPGGEDQLYYAFWEASSRPHGDDAGESPVVLWLQGGPGCASSFGAFYELGPMWVTPDLDIEPNPGSWNHHAGLLIIDQPIGTGLSFIRTSDAAIPRDEMGMAGHLHAALQNFFNRHPAMQQRPFFITGESYGGKYVPSLAHFILQAEQQGRAAGDALAPSLKHTRKLHKNITHPLFKLKGVAIGNGLTDPRSQTLTLAATVWSAGLVSSQRAEDLGAFAEKVVALIDQEQWQEAHVLREELRAAITDQAGLATMFDTRRTSDYDPTKAVDRFLNLPQVRSALRASKTGVYKSCSEAVDKAMAADTMQSVAYLVPDLLANIHVLLYQGQFDVLDGPRSNTAWMEMMDDWPQLEEFVAQNSSLWSLPNQKPEDADSQAQFASRHGPGRQQQHGCGSAAACNLLWRLGMTAERATHKELRGPVGTAAAGWVRAAGRLTHAVVYRAGHMVPHDQPEAMEALLERWISHTLDDVDKA